jgi:AI-2 transport protein TqsA
MKDGPTDDIKRLLVMVACVVIILCGVSRTSHLVVLVLLSILLACSFLPLPEWLIKRFELGKGAAIGLAVALLGTLSLVAVFSLGDRIYRLRAELPAYHQRFMVLFESVVAFLDRHGIKIDSLAHTTASTSDRILEMGRVAVPAAAGFLGDGLLVTLLALIFLSAMVQQTGAKANSLGERMRYYGEDVQRYIGILAKTSAIAALANLVLLLVLGVQFPLLWCILSFFLRFIPNVGFLIAIVPPSLVTLLVLGWKRALLVLSGLILINLVMDYVVNPIFMKKGADVSFLELMLSLLFWGALLGVAGGILAVPLTLALRKFIDKQSFGGKLASAPG